MASNQKKNDRLLTGLLAGLLLPLFIFLIIYVARYPDVPLSKYLGELWRSDLLMKIMSLCVFPNLFLFLLYIRRKMDRISRGILAATLFYALLVILSKIF
jgi:uncharacterized membrane protein